eukprot:TRINITY_DN32831_c0_g1_i1.p1 TRINITY_DN32831_c0_g1~~TRINITY_DN32831_c0_g1_i1.p1  ORF type:complete len:205 (+),score=56.24 TRINITY_DN32831_c0_g1_i1:143-757(+)
MGGQGSKADGMPSADAAAQQKVVPEDEFMRASFLGFQQGAPGGAPEESVKAVADRAEALIAKTHEYEARSDFSAGERELENAVQLSIDVRGGETSLEASGVSISKRMYGHAGASIGLFIVLARLPVVMRRWVREGSSPQKLLMGNAGTVACAYLAYYHYSRWVELDLLQLKIDKRSRLMTHSHMYSQRAAFLYYPVFHIPERKL